MPRERGTPAGPTAGASTPGWWSHRGLWPPWHSPPARPPARRRRWPRRWGRRGCAGSRKGCHPALAGPGTPVAAPAPPGRRAPPPPALRAPLEDGGGRGPPPLVASLAAGAARPVSLLATLPQEGGPVHRQPGVPGGLGGGHGRG